MHQNFFNFRCTEYAILGSCITSKNVKEIWIFFSLSVTPDIVGVVREKPEKKSELRLGSLSQDNGFDYFSKAVINAIFCLLENLNT